MKKDPRGRKSPVKIHTLKVRITDQELQTLESYACYKGCSMSDVIRRYISRLRVPKQTDEKISE